MQSSADMQLECLRSDQNSGLIPRLENLNAIVKEFALEGSWEKTETLVLNMKNDCKILITDE